MAKVRQLEQRDWDQLLIVASGFLPLTNGNLREAMAQAIAAHSDLIRAVREEGITTHVARGKVTLFVPDDGGIALAFESNRARREREAASEGIRTAAAPDLSDLVLEVVEPTRYVTRDEDEPGPEGDRDWPDVG